MSKKYVYLFSEGNANMRELLGGKGANLAEMTNIGLPVPQGFTITTEACTQYYEDGQKINDGIQAEIMEYITKLEGINGLVERLGKVVGDQNRKVGVLALFLLEAVAVDHGKVVVVVFLRHKAAGVLAEGAHLVLPGLGVADKLGLIQHLVHLFHDLVAALQDRKSVV